jgi:class 3 adenylate cyclase
MKCARCQHDNEPGAKFCEECAAPFAQTCARCGRPLSPAARFCPECAHPTARSVDPVPRFESPGTYTPRHLAEKILTSKSGLEGERKQVTVMFADLRGSMELLADRDPEDARRLLDPVLEQMMEAVHRYEGTVNQVMGDGIMALFGAPIAHEDHALRACYAALRMQESVRRFAAARADAEDVAIQIRIGLNSGEVVVRAIGSDLRMDYTAVGQTTHLAARMEQLATPGTTLMTRDMLELVDGFVEVVPRGAVRVKGLAAPIAVCELVGASQVRSRLQAVSAARGFTSFVGRDLEIAQLDRALALAGEGHGQAVALVGEPGVGKSRLVHEFVWNLRDRDWLVLEGSAVPLREATPYQLFLDVLRSYFQVEAGDDPRSVRERVEARVLGLDPALAGTLPALWAFLDVLPRDEHWDALDPPQRRQRMLDALRQLLGRVSQSRPLLLLFEDVQWADSGSRAALDVLVESLPGARILLLLTGRQGHDLAWEHHRCFTSLRLDPLSAGSLGALIDVLVGPGTSAAGLRPLLAARTEGNPLFLEETVRTLVDSGVLVGRPGAYALTRPVSTVQVPRTVEAILAARIDLLAPEDKRLLQVAAAIGRDVPFVILEAVADLDEGALHEGLERLRAAEFLHQVRLFPDREYTFKHALTHEVAYLSLLRSSRRTYHLRIAQAIERRAPAVAETQPEVLAHHWDEAGAHDRAVVLWQRAARRALERSAHAEAVRHVTRGLAALDTLPEGDERARRAIALHLLRTNSIAVTRGYAELGDVCATLRELAERAGTDTVTALRLIVPQWMYHTAAGPLTVARTIADRGLALAEEAGDPAWIVLSSLAAAHTLRIVGEFSSALALADRGLGLYVTAEHSPRILRSEEDSGAYLMRDRVASLWPLGYPDQALAQARAAIAHARRLSHPFTLGSALLSAARLHWLAGEPAAARPLIDEGLGLARQYGFALMVSWLLAFRGWALCAGGRLAEGLPILRDSVASLRAASVVVGLPVGMLSIAAALTADGHAGEALAVLDEARALVTASGELEHDSPLARARGEALLRAGDEAGAAREFQAAVEAARRQQARGFELAAATRLAGLLAGQGRREEARALLGDVHATFTEGFGTPHLRAARALLDTLA